jgi:hypothetical protein
MADKEYTPYQKGVIKRYYENKDDISSQKLGEVVSDLYLATNPKNQKRLWASAESALLNLGVKKEKVEKIVKARDLEALAKLASELF